MGEYSMKKKLRVFSGIVTLSLLFSAVVITVGAHRPPPGWYVKRNREHKQPTPDLSMEMLEQYDAYFIDKKHGDDTKDKVIYLTFDAGYENGNVAKILDVLKKEDVSAAFFVLDQIILHDTDLIKRMEKEGHLVCNHTKNHRDVTTCKSKEELERELSALEAVYREKIGKEMPKYFRPPEGKFNEQTLKWASELGYKTVFWIFAYADWDNQRQPARDKAMSIILENTHNGEVMLLHPTSRTNAEILSDVIIALKNDGYRFGTLDELTA